MPPASTRPEQDSCHHSVCTPKTKHAFVASLFIGLTLFGAVANMAVELEAQPMPEHGSSFALYSLLLI